MSSEESKYDISYEIWSKKYRYQGGAEVARDNSPEDTFRRVAHAIAANEMYTVAFNQLSYTWAYTHFQEMGTMDTQIKSALGKLEKGRGTSQEVLDKAVKEVQDEINDK